MKLKDIAQFKHEQTLLNLVRSKGIPRNQVEALNEEFDRKPKSGEAYYYYTGPDDEKTRKFCKTLLKLDKVISETEINALSSLTGYDVLEYRGSYNCRHKWVRFRGKIISTPPLTTRQLDNLNRIAVK